MGNNYPFGITTSSTSATVEPYWGQPTIVDPSVMTTLMLGDTNRGEDNELRVQVERAKREKDYLDWYYGLRIGESTVYYDGSGIYREPVSRVVGGWVHHYPSGAVLIPFVERREDA